MPESVVCEGGSNLVFADLTPTDSYGGLFVSKINLDEIMLNGNDGDQVSMMKLKLSELRDLAKGRVSSVLALTASGFWWADGDHITAGTTTCTLPRAK